MSKRTSPSLALVPPRQKVLKKVSQKLQRNILESKGRTVEQLEQIQVVLQVLQGCNVLMAESCVAPADDVLEVVGWYFGRRDVQGQDIVGDVGEGQVLPALPIGGGGDLLGDVQAAVGGETLEHDVFKRQLGEDTSCQRWARVAALGHMERGGQALVVLHRNPRRECSGTAARASACLAGWWEPVRRWT